MAGKALKSFSCPACGGVVEIHAVGHTISAVCDHCSTIIDTTNDNFRIIKKEHKAIRPTDIAMGAKGVLYGIKWEVIGYVEKKDKSTMSYWDEYLLFNPYFGFRFLIQADGHWNFATIVKRYFPKAGIASEVMLDGEKFNVYCRGQATVGYVKGEFYWRVRTGDVDIYTDYIAPPKMLSVEANKQEITESLADYIEPGEIEKAFGIELQDKVGIAANQPPPFAGTLGNLWKIASVAILVALIVQWSAGSSTPVNNTRISVVQNDKDKTFSTPVFNLPRSTNLFVRSIAPVSNNWMELELSLVNELTNKTYQSRQVIEHYAGSDDGESWSEGGQMAESTFSAVPGGNYRLLVESSSGLLGSSSVDINLEIKRDIPAWGNFWFIFLCIILLPLFALLYRWRFENKRWENSDFAPAVFRIGESDD